MNSVMHSIGNSHANFSCNQSRAYTKLDTLFATLTRSEVNGVHGSVPASTKKPVSWFQGYATDHASNTALTATTDNLEAYLTIGSKRIPLFPETKANMHYYRLLQACG